MGMSACCFTPGKIQQSDSISKASIANHLDANKTLVEVMRNLKGSTSEIVAKSKTIFFPGDSADKVYLIRRGAVRLSRINESGQEISIALLGKGSVFGALPLLDRQQLKMSTHAMAFSRVSLETAPATALTNIIKTESSIGLLFLQSLSSRIFHSDAMIEILKKKDISSRLASFLLLLSRDFGIESKTGVTIDLRISQEGIAEAIGSSRVTITRILGELKSSGLLTMDKQKVTIFDSINLAKRFI